MQSARSARSGEVTRQYRGPYKRPRPAGGNGGARPRAGGQRAPPRKAPSGETDRLAANAVVTPPMASTRPRLLRAVRGSILRRAATSIVIRGVVERGSAPRAAVV